MAFVIPSTNPQDPKVYNVGQAVGPLAPNIAGDVKLVQYMLKHLYGPRAASLNVDGYIGPTTISLIKRFQQDANYAKVNVLVDGRIDRALGQVASISRTVYTILVLNTTLREQNPAAYAAVPQHVPLTGAPAPPPSKPGKKIIVVQVLGWLMPPFDVFVFYDDRTVDRWVVNASTGLGPIFPNGTPVIRIPRVLPNGAFV